MEYTTEIELNSGQRPSRRRTSNWHSLSTNSPCFQPVMCCPSSAPEKGWCLPWPFRGCESVLLGPQRLPLTLTLRHLPRFRCLLCGATFGVLGILHPRLHGETRGFHSVPWRPTEGGVHQPWYQATLRVGVECWLVPGSGVTHTPSVVVWAEVGSTLATWQPSASESLNRVSTSISRATLVQIGPQDPLIWGPGPQVVGSCVEQTPHEAHSQQHGFLHGSRFHFLLQLNSQTPQQPSVLTQTAEPALVACAP